MTNTKGQHISIWFFVGVLLATYGVIILGAGLATLGEPPDPKLVLQELHMNLWWGVLLLAVGAVYSWKFWPGKA